MKQFISYILFALILVSCGAKSDHFKLEGRLLNLNQGEFYLYATDGGLDNIDTITVRGGRFAIDIPCKEKTTLMLVFSNFSEQPVFAEPGKKVTLKADAYHLKALTMEGTDDNELMNQFRESIADASPEQTRRLAKSFAEQHADSPVATYLVRKYFVFAPIPDYPGALALLKRINAAQPNNPSTARLALQVEQLNKVGNRKTLPSFSVKDINGKTFSQAKLNQAQSAVILLWASYSFPSTTMLRELAALKQRANGKIEVLTINADPSVQLCKQALGSDSLSLATVCDRNMLESDLIKKLGLTNLPDNILLEKGVIKGRNFNLQQLTERLDPLTRQ